MNNSVLLKAAALEDIEVQHREMKRWDLCLKFSADNLDKA